MFSVPIKQNWIYLVKRLVEQMRFLRIQQNPQHQNLFLELKMLSAQISLDRSYQILPHLVRSNPMTGRAMMVKTLIFSVAVLQFIIFSEINWNRNKYGLVTDFIDDFKKMKH